MDSKRGKGMDELCNYIIISKIKEKIKIISEIGITGPISCQFEYYQ